MKTSINRFFNVLLFMAFIPVFAMSQGKIKVSGIVTSEEDSEPIIGVTVQVVGSKGNGVITARCCICR